jgi:AP2-like factor, ANT lineage
MCLHAAGLGCGGELGSIATGLGCDGELGIIATGFLRQYPARGMPENPGAVTIAMGTEVDESDQARRSAETFGSP